MNNTYYVINFYLHKSLSEQVTHLLRLVNRNMLFLIFCARIDGQPDCYARSRTKIPPINYCVPRLFSIKCNFHGFKSKPTHIKTNTEKKMVFISCYKWICKYSRGALSSRQPDHLIGYSCYCHIRCYCRCLYMLCTSKVLFWITARFVRGSLI